MTNKVGLALSGGGARGLAHIGVLNILEQEGIEIDYLAGTSMGGFIAALYAAGLSPSFMWEEALRMSRPRNLLSLIDLSPPRRGLFEGNKIYEYMASHLGDRTFDDLQIPLTLVATNLSTGQQVHFNQGRVVDAARATIAIPGILTPVKQGEQLLVDGGLLNNLPADVVRGMGADVIIAVDVTSKWQLKSTQDRSQHNRHYMFSGFTETVDVLWRSLEIMRTDLDRRQLEEAQPEIVLQPTIPHPINTLTGFTHASEIITAGEQVTIKALPRIHALCASTTLLPTYKEISLLNN
ncbi:MAG: patatin-like phospholipase family protein [Anaerolineae bacterium]|nr:patatin-like phospholipase family protein [Anaerolineae bacterium]